MGIYTEEWFKANRNLEYGVATNHDGIFCVRITCFQSGYYEFHVLGMEPLTTKRYSKIAKLFRDWLKMIPDGFHLAIPVCEGGLIR